MWLYLFTCSKLSFSPSLSVYDVKSEFLIPFLLFPSWDYISRNQTHLDSISRKCISYPHYFNFLLLTWPCLKCWNNVVLFVKSYFCLTVLNLYHFTLCFSVSFCGIRVFMWNTIYNCHTIYPSICGTTSIILSMVYHLSVYLYISVAFFLHISLCVSVPPFCPSLRVSDNLICSACLSNFKCPSLPPGTFRCTSIFSFFPFDTLHSGKEQCLA